MTTTIHALERTQQRALRPVAGYLPADERTSKFLANRPVVLKNTVGYEAMTLVDAKALISDLMVAVNSAEHREIV